MVKTVSFKKGEKEIIEFLKDKDFSSYIKILIKKDMQNNNTDIPTRVDKIESKKRRNTKFDM